jgi:hypothetical protein
VPCPWNPSRGLGLVDILRAWKRCVEEGHWTVGEDGVEGGFQDLEGVDGRCGRVDWAEVEL